MNPLLKELGIPALVAAIITSTISFLSSRSLSKYKKEIDQELGEYKTENDKIVERLKTDLKIYEERFPFYIQKE